jgi:tRNA1(Val) A37 N6-methylase TrmN6
MAINLKENERLDDLQQNGYKIIQNSKLFCFGMDAVLLSSFAMANEGDQVLDLGTGNGVIPILMEAKTKAAHFTGLEIQDMNVDMAIRSVDFNGITDKIEILKGDIKEASSIFGGASFNVVTSNPPYMNENHGLVNPNNHKAIARHEILCTLEDVIREASKVLKVKGKFYMVHRPQRMVEIFNMLTKYTLEPKRIRMVHPYADKAANMILIEAVKGANSLLKVEQPLIIYEQAGIYTEELCQLYKWYE